MRSGALLIIAVAIAVLLSFILISSRPSPFPAKADLADLPAESEMAAAEQVVASAVSTTDDKQNPVSIVPDERFDESTKLHYLLFKPQGWTSTEKWPLLVRKAR